MLLRIENYARIFGQNTEPVDYYATAARKVLVVQPSSAASERVFSLLNNAFSQQQHSALQDYIEASIMMQYNRR